jgi:hypothetical protein
MRIFKEEQRFTQPILIVMISISTLVFLGILLKEYFTENSKMESLELTLIIVFYFACIIPLLFFKLTTRIDEKGIHYKFFPFHRSYKIKTWAEIKSANVRKYDAISEYGGWGFKGSFRRKKGKAINVKGSIGIQLELTNSKKLLIGTQKENDVKKVLETYKNKFASFQEEN